MTPGCGQVGTHGGRAGFTLLELLLVVLLLSAVAMLALNGVESRQDQLRFEDTRHRIERIRTAVLGDAGSTAPSGFLADVGRLPESLDELLFDLEPPALATWQFHAPTGLWGGWRGPYLPVARNSSGVEPFGDGWAWPIQLADAKHGWKMFERSADGSALYVQSFGADGQPGGFDYQADYPPAVEPGGLPMPVVAAHDVWVDLRGSLISVTIVNTGAADVDLPATRLRCWYPQDGSFDWPEDWPATPAARDDSPWLSELLQAATIAAGESVTLPVRFLAPDLQNAAPKPVPAGLRGFSLLRDADGIPAGTPQPAQPWILEAPGGPPQFAMDWKVAP